jgi:Na+/H+ antiporter
VSGGQSLILLALGLVTLVAVAGLRPFGVPAPVVLVLAGLLTGFLPFAPDLALQPDVVLLGLLPLLVFHAGTTSSPTAFVRHARSIGILAVALVVATAAAVAAVAHWLGDLSWPMAFVLGTAVCPTDPAAATGIARQLGLPRRVLTILEGESLFNDVTGLVLFAAAVTAATTGHFSALHTSGTILFSTTAGAAIGLAVGLIGRWARRLVDDPTIEIAGSILLAYSAYLPAHALGASGVLAAAVAGLYLGYHRSTGGVSATSRLQSAAFWENLVFLIDAVLFLLLGLSLRSFHSNAIGPPGHLILTGAAVVAVVIAVRMAWMLTLGRLIRVEPDRSTEYPDWRERVILGWGGMRGAITLAALLAVPQVTDAGRPLAGRDDIIYLGFAVIVATLVVQGVSLPILVRRMNLAEHPAVAESERRARLTVAQAALDHLAAAGADGAELTAGLRAELNTVQRRKLNELRRQRLIGSTIVRKIEHELDLEEVRPPRA